MNSSITLKQFADAVNSIAAYVKERVATVNQALATKVGDAPADGKTYVRKNGNWEDLTIPEQQTINYATDEEVAEIINNAFKD